MGRAEKVVKLDGGLARVVLRPRYSGAGSQLLGGGGLEAYSVWVASDMNTVLKCVFRVLLTSSDACSQDLPIHQMALGAYMHSGVHSLGAEGETLCVLSYPSYSMVTSGGWEVHSLG